MTSPTTEIRWLITDRAHQQLAVDVSLRRSPSFADEPIASGVVGLEELASEFSGHDAVSDLLKDWLIDDPSLWKVDGPAGSVDPVEGWAHDDVAAEWGSFLGRLLVARVVGTGLDTIIQKAVAGADGPTVRMLFALRGIVARRLPVELLLWPNGPPGPITAQRGLSILREGEPNMGATPTKSFNKPRIVVAGVAPPDFVDDDEWQRLALAIDDHEPGDFRGRVGPGLAERPDDALHALSKRSGDVAIVWGHGIRQVDEQSYVWPATAGSATATDIAVALGDRYGAAVVAMCHSASEGEHGQRSVISRLVSNGLPFGIGFQGRPATTVVSDALRRFVQSLRTDHPPGPDAFEAYELALYRVRTESGDGHTLARQLVAEVTPRLTAGRRRRSPFYGDAHLIDADHILRAYRTAGQLLITRMADHRLVRIPLPVDPLDFRMHIDGGVLRLDHAVPGLKSDLERALELWDGLNLPTVDLAGATQPGRTWGLQSAMLDAVVAEIEQITGEGRPDTVADLVHRSRRKDWGSPAMMSVVQIDDGATLCTLGPPLEDVHAEIALRAPGAEKIDLRPLTDEVSPTQDAAEIDWQMVDQAVAGNRDALERLINNQFAALRVSAARGELRPELDVLPDGCLGFPSLTRLVQSEL